MPQPDAPALTGDTLIAEVLHNMEAGLFALGATVLVPYRYEVVLHPRDHDAIRSVIPFLREEAERALGQRVAELNRPDTAASLLGRLGIATSASPRLHRVPGDRFEIDFVADHDGTLPPGTIEVHSDLAPPQRAEYAVGQNTVRITRRDSDGQATSRTDSSPAATMRTGTATATEQPVLARLRWQDQEGAHDYAVRHDEVTIGRGGKGYLVDVVLRVPEDVSRAHCRLTRDRSTGSFGIIDLSTFGTMVNGRPAPNGEAVTPLPLGDRATLVLAGVASLEFVQGAET